MNFVDTYYETIAAKMRSREAQDEFLLAILRYYYDGEEPSFEHDVSDVAFAAIRYSLDKARAGRLGGQAKPQANSQAKPEAKAEANLEANSQEKTQGNAEETAKPDIGIYKGIGNKEKKGRFTPPTPAEVEEYSRERGHPIDGQSFCDFYASKGWLVGKTPMKDWRAAVRTWISRDAGDGKGGGASNASVERFIGELAF